MTWHDALPPLLRHVTRYCRYERDDTITYIRYDEPLLLMPYERYDVERVAIAQLILL